MCHFMSPVDYISKLSKGNKKKFKFKYRGTTKLLRISILSLSHSVYSYPVWNEDD